MIECGQKNCTERATHSYFWPGKAGCQFICNFHRPQLTAIAGALGFHLHLQPINEDDET